LKFLIKENFIETSKISTLYDFTEIAMNHKKFEDLNLGKRGNHILKIMRNKVFFHRIHKTSKN